MHLKASKHPAMIVFYVSFSYPVVPVWRSISLKLNQMGPVVMLVHVVGSLNVISDCFCALVSSFYLFLDGFGEPSVCPFGCALPVLGLVRARAGFVIL